MLFVLPVRLLGDQSPIAIRLIGVLGFVFMIVVFQLLARALFGRTWSIIAAFPLAASPWLIFQTARGLREETSTALTLLFCLGLIKPRLTGRRFVLLFALAGLTGLLRWDAMVMMLPVLVIALIRYRPHPAAWVLGPAVVGLGTNGMVTIYNGVGSADAVVDLEGYYAPSSGGTAGGFVALSPARITDTRSGSGEPNAGSTLTTGATLNVQVTGAGGVPSSAEAVVLNVTVTGTTDSSFLTVYPTGSRRPLASNLNWTAGEQVANRVVASDTTRFVAATARVIGERITYRQLIGKERSPWAVVVRSRIGFPAPSSRSSYPRAAAR